MRGRTGAAGLADLPLPDRPLADPDNPQVSHTLRRVDGQVRVETRVSDKVLRAVVDYALGSSDRYTCSSGGTNRGKSAPCGSRIIGAPRGRGDRSKGQSVHPHRIDEFLGERFGSDDEWAECLVCHTTSARAARLRRAPSPRTARSAASGATVRAACMSQPCRPGSLTWRSPTPPRPGRRRSISRAAVATASIPCRCPARAPPRTGPGSPARRSPGAAATPRAAAS